MCRSLKDAITWTRPAPLRFQKYVIERMLHVDPSQRPSVVEAMREMSCMLECLEGWVDSEGFLKAPYSLADITHVYPPPGPAEAGEAMDV